MSLTDQLFGGRWPSIRFGDNVSEIRVGDRINCGPRCAIVKTSKCFDRYATEKGVQILARRVLESVLHPPGSTAFATGGRPCPTEPSRMPYGITIDGSCAMRHTRVRPMVSARKCAYIRSP